MSRSKKDKKADSQTEQMPNIQYVGKRQKLDKEKLKMTHAAKQVPEFIMDGKTKIKLPEGIEHGIYLPEETAARLFALRPDDFKTPVVKAQKTSPVMPPAKPVVEPKGDSTVVEDEVNK